MIRLFYQFLKCHYKEARIKIPIKEWNSKSGEYGQKNTKQNLYFQSPYCSPENMGFSKWYESCVQLNFQCAFDMSFIDNKIVLRCITCDLWNGNIYHRSVYFLLYNANLTGKYCRPHTLFTDVYLSGFSMPRDSVICIMVITVKCMGKSLQINWIVFLMSDLSSYKHRCFNVYSRNSITARNFLQTSV